MSEETGATTDSGQDVGGATDAASAPLKAETSTGIERPSFYTDKGDPGEAVPTVGKTKAGADDDATGGKQAAPPGPDASQNSAGKDGTGKGDTKDSSDDGQGKEDPPKGYVPTEAVKEVRGENRMLRDKLTDAETRIANLTAQLATRQAAPEPKEFADFKVLNDEELELLAEDDPVAAAQYVKTLAKYEKYMDQQEMSKAEQEQREKQWRDQESVARGRIKEAIADYDALAASLGDHGFDEDLYILTDPATKIITADGTVEPLNQRAARLVESLVSLTTPKAITVDDVPESIREQIIASVSADILNKVKGKATDRSVSKLPTSKQSEPGGDPLQGKSYAQMTKQEREQYLRGE